MPHNNNAPYLERLTEAALDNQPLPEPSDDQARLERAQFSQTQAILEGFSPLPLSPGWEASVWQRIAADPLADDDWDEDAPDIRHDTGIQSQNQHQKSAFAALSSAETPLPANVFPLHPAPPHSASAPKVAARPLEHPATERGHHAGHPPNPASGQVVDARGRWRGALWPVLALAAACLLVIFASPPSGSTSHAPTATPNAEPPAQPTSVARAEKEEAPIAERARGQNAPKTPTNQASSPPPPPHEDSNEAAAHALNADEDAHPVPPPATAPAAAPLKDLYAADLRKPQDPSRSAKPKQAEESQEHERQEHERQEHERQTKPSADDQTPKVPPPDTLAADLPNHPTGKTTAGLVRSQNGAPDAAQDPAAAQDTVRVLILDAEGLPWGGAEVLVQQDPPITVRALSDGYVVLSQDQAQTPLLLASLDRTEGGDGKSKKHKKLDNLNPKARDKTGDKTSDHVSPTNDRTDQTKGDTAKGDQNATSLAKNNLPEAAPSDPPKDTGSAGATKDTPNKDVMKDAKPAASSDPAKVALVTPPTVSPMDAGAATGATTPTDPEAAEIAATSARKTASTNELPPFTLQATYRRALPPTLPIDLVIVPLDTTDPAQWLGVLSYLQENIQSTPYPVDAYAALLSRPGSDPHAPLQEFFFSAAVEGEAAKQAPGGGLSPLGRFAATQSALVAAPMPTASSSLLAALLERIQWRSESVVRLLVIVAPPTHDLLTRDPALSEALLSAAQQGVRVVLLDPSPIGGEVIDTTTTAKVAGTHTIDQLFLSEARLLTYRSVPITHTRLDALGAAGSSGVGLPPQDKAEAEVIADTDNSNDNSKENNKEKDLDGLYKGPDNKPIGKAGGDQLSPPSTSPTEVALEAAVPEPIAQALLGLINDEIQALRP